MPINFNQETNMQKPIVIHGPQGCGKTQHAAALASHFGASRLVDGWNGRDALQPGDLALTNSEAVKLPDRATVISFERAMQAMARSMNGELSQPCAA